MNAHTTVEVARQNEQGKEYLRNLNAGTAPEAESFDEPKQSPNVVWPEVLDDDTFASFFGGAGSLS